ncbi:hypothetical protein FHR90_001141 [Endobacter medicaginis]|jgi:hypothetical protein|uniref:Putative zinc-binding metallopeptidase n=1 Tax=Endobacter medicaginis TaxID=1181271 RepID=A0A850NLM9_9PROT|nr:putative zinc-binding metallopeptidase [Endobacter medicaginis]MBB3173323.1 hypothetical protein [Endobacter medicaginis]MCX5475716.1 putative zinc-binding metallopeptidase [Endobacter medicaginis]NVN28820.1 putative zinc-binding metallopeptidase [Endobacter medicaginis]
MKLLTCSRCQSVVHFEAEACPACGAALGFLPEALTIVALDPTGDDADWLWLAPARYETGELRFCANRIHHVCNWMLPASGTAAGALCPACRTNRIIPDLSRADALDDWRKLEIAKHRLFYTMLRLGISLPDPADPDTPRLEFDLLHPVVGQPKIRTGHAGGIVTINAAEASDAIREQVRHQFNEPYRTLLGHFRHEIGHWVWAQRVQHGGRIEAFRTLFGDERTDYAEALRRYYAEGPRQDWPAHFISAYASAHPWEDFAESWAHYLHIMDTLETAFALGIGIHPGNPDTSLPDLDTRDPYRIGDMHRILDQWLPLVFALNSLNRSMGLADLYPFAIPPAAEAKLAFIHDLVRAG